MSRVSQEELYNDKDVVTQILKLKDIVNDYAGGIIENIDVSGNDLVIDWADGTSVSLPLPSPTGISSIAGSVSGGNLTITIYMTDGSSHAFTCPLMGFVTLDTEQILTAKKIFSVSPEVPTTPATPFSAINDVYANDATEGVNNLLHKTGNETKNGKLTLKAPSNVGNMNVYSCGTASSSGNGWYEVMRTKDGVNTDGVHVHIKAKDVYITGIDIVEYNVVWKPSSATPELRGYVIGSNAAYKITDMCVTLNHDGTFSLFMLKRGTYSKEVITVEAVDNRGIPTDPTLYFDVKENATNTTKPVVDNVNYDYVADGVSFDYFNGVLIQ